MTAASPSPSTWYRRVLAAVFVITASVPAHGEILTFACNGTVTGMGIPETPVSMGVVINLTARTLHVDRIGVIPIVAVDAAEVRFERTDHTTGEPISSIHGNINRITGDLEDTFYSGSLRTVSQHLKCNPAQRLF